MKDMLQRTLADLGRIGGVRGAVMVDPEAGVPVAVSDGMEGERVAALATALHGRLGRAAAGSDFGRAGVVEVVGAEGRLLIGGGEILVVVIADPDAPADRLRQEMRGILEVLR